MNRTFWVLTMVDDAMIVYIRLLHIFGIVFFYQEFDQNILLAVAPFALGHIVYAVFVGLSTKLIGKIGTRISILMAILFVVLAAPVLYAYDQTQNLLWFFAWFGVLYIAKLFFHPPVLYLLGRVTSHEQRGSQLGYRQVTVIIINFLVPLLGGILAATYGLLGMVMFATIIVVIAIIPTLFLPNLKFNVNLNWKKIRSYPRTRELVVTDTIFFVQRSGTRIWPIIVFLALGSSFTEMGTLIAITTGISILGVLFVGRFLDDHNRTTVFKWITIGRSISWVMRMLAATPLFITIADLFGRFVYELGEETVETLNIDYMNHGLPLEEKDEMVIVREIAINLAIGIGDVMIAVLALLLGLQGALILPVFMFLGIFALRGFTSHRLPKADAHFHGS